MNSDVVDTKTRVMTASTRRKRKNSLCWKKKKKPTTTKTMKKQLKMMKNTRTKSWMMMPKQERRKKIEVGFEDEEKIDVTPTTTTMIAKDEVLVLQKRWSRGWQDSS